MKLLEWLAKFPKGVIFGVAWATEIIGGVILKVFFGTFATTGEFLAFCVGSGILAHYIELLVEHLRPRKPHDLLETFDALPEPNRATAERTNMRAALEMVIESGGALPPELLKIATRLTSEYGRSDDAGQQQMVKWLAVLERFDRHEMSREFIKQLSETLNHLKVPRQVESIFTSSLSKEAARMAELAQQRPVAHVDLATQYVYASGVAEYYETRARVASIYATALDVPSVFYGDHEPYFQKQQPLLTDTDRFVQYAEKEIDNVDLIIDVLDGKSAGRPARYVGLPAEKSRIVVIDKAALAADVDNDNFWEFVVWHAQHHFGLKFFIRDQVASDKSDWYEKELATFTGLPREQTIDDFIVYGDECVFGRVDPKPDAQGRVTLGFHYAARGAATNGAVIPKYRKFFETLWNDRRTHAATDLWDFPEIEKKLRAKRERYEALSKAYLKAYRALTTHTHKEAS